MTAEISEDSLPLDVARIREDFPILASEVHGKPLVYLDNAATSQKPRQVIDAITSYYESWNANVHRSPHKLGQVATDLYEGARDRVAEYVNAPARESVIWTRGTTEAINLVATAWGGRNIGAGDTILVTEMEHHSNLVPWHMLAKRTGCSIRFVPITPEGRLDLDVARERIAEGPKLFAFSAKSNVLGTENPVSEFCALAREAGAVTLVDGAQALPHGDVDFAQLGCDFLAFSAHKALGPMGIGALIVNPARYEEMDPYQGGGEMIKRVKIDSSSYAKPPLMFEAGTPSVGDVVGFHAALDYLDQVGPARIHAHEARLTALGLDLLNELGVKTWGPDDPSERAGIISFQLDEIHPHDVATLLDNYGIAVRAGHHCAQPLMRKYGVPASARASFYLYNTEEEVHQLAKGVKAVREYFKR